MVVLKHGNIFLKLIDLVRRLCELGPNLSKDLEICFQNIFQLPLV